MENSFNIKKIRIENNKNQNEVAELMNVSRSSYSMWETNNNIFPIARLIDFCNIFKVSVDYALGLSLTNNKVFGDIDKIKSGTRLKEFRKESKLTQAKLADYLKTHMTVICNYEKGRYIIATPFLYTICKKYNISADYLLGRIDNPMYLK